MSSSRLKKPPRKPDPEYVHFCRGVLSGETPSCELVRHACSRHMEDLQTAPERGLYFDPGAAEHAISFFPAFLAHSKGEWAGQPLELLPWEAFITAMLFGWMREDGKRRYRTAYIEVPRKNGKSTFAAGVGLYMFDADGEPGAEVYSAATKRDQAKIIFSEAQRMVGKSRFLNRRINVLANNMHVEATASKFEPLSADDKTLDGLNIHCGLIDEFHAHRTGDVYNLIDTATGSRSQPLIFIITTAGSDITSACYDMHAYTEKILSGVIEDDSFFGMIFTVDDPEKWGDEAEWFKANPSLGEAKKLEDMRRKYRKAQEIPSLRNAFQRLELNIWTGAETAWITPEAWSACEEDLDFEELARLRCWAGVDLSSTTDLSACALIFEPDSRGRQAVLVSSWVPGENIEKRARSDRVPYDVWARNGWISSTSGNVIDHDCIRLTIRDDLKTRFPLLQAVGFDPWNATKWAVDMEGDGIPVLPIRQGYKTLSPACKELERIVMGGMASHRGNPVLAWCLNNVVVSSDPAENIKPDKARSIERIDALVALVIAIATRQELEGEDRESIYEGRGIVSL